MTARQVLELAMRIQLRQNQVQFRTLKSFSEAVKGMNLEA